MKTTRSRAVRHFPLSTKDAAATHWIPSAASGAPAHWQTHPGCILCPYPTQSPVSTAVESARYIRRNTCWRENQKLNV